MTVETREEVIEPLLAPRRFAGIEGVTHLCTGGESPWLVDQEDVYRRFAVLKGGGLAGRNEVYATGDRCREKVGRLWGGVAPDRIAFMPSSAEAMSWLARGLDWREGDNVVTTRLEFPSVAYAWRNLRARGVEIRMVPARDWVVDEADLLAAVDARTRVLAVSHVSFYTGQCLDLERLAQARAGGALLAVDATHASGVIPVPAGVTDVTMSSCYKWMLATHGVAPCYVSERAEEHIAATSFGWRNLDVYQSQQGERADEADEMPMPDRFEPGNPAMQVIMHVDHAAETLLGIGLERTAAHARALSGRAMDVLEEAGYEVITPRDPLRRAGNACCLAPDPTALRDRLAEHGVLVWADAGRMRVSTHVFNGSADVERLAEVLREIG